MTDHEQIDATATDRYISQQQQANQLLQLKLQFALSETGKIQLSQ